MPDDPERAWLLLDYKGPVERWVREYKPSLPVILKVRDWLRSREVHPLDGVRYAPGIKDYYYGVVPGTMGTDGRVVTCNFWVFRDDMVVRVDFLSTVSWPV